MNKELSVALKPQMVSIWTDVLIYSNTAHAFIYEFLDGILANYGKNILHLTVL